MSLVTVTSFFFPFPLPHCRTLSSLTSIRYFPDDSLTIIEKVIGFMIDTYRSLLMCTIEFVVRGTLAVVIGVVQAVSTRFVLDGRECREYSISNSSRLTPG